MATNLPSTQAILSGYQPAGKSEATWIGRVLRGLLETKRGILDRHDSGKSFLERRRYTRLADEASEISLAVAVLDTWVEVLPN